MLGNIVVISVILIIFSLIGFLLWFAYNFHKYKGKLYAKVLKENGEAVRQEISDKFTYFSLNDEETAYLIDKSQAYMDHWAFPRKTIYYLENYSKPISRVDEVTESDNGNELPLKTDNITPVELNYLLGIEFDKLFKTETEGFFSGVSLPKKWLIVGSVIVVIIILLLYFAPDLLQLVGSGGKPIPPENVAP